MTAPFGFEAALLNGIADFAAERAKQEVLVYVIDNFGKALCSRNLDGYDVRTFFPETCHLLAGETEVVGDTLHQIGSTFQVALQADIRGLLPVVLNFAVSISQKRGVSKAVIDKVDEILAGLIQDQPIATLMDNLNLTQVQSECDGKGGQACAFELFVYVSQAGLAPGSCREEAMEVDCLSSIVTSVNNKLQRSTKLKQWAEDHRITAALETELAIARALRDFSVARATARVGKLWLLVRAVAEILPPEEAKWFHRIDRAFVQWGTLGVALYQTIEGVTRGGDPLALIPAALEGVPCQGVADARCGFRAAGTVIETILTCKRDELQALVTGDRLDPVKVAAFLEAAKSCWSTILGRQGNEDVKKWVDARVNQVVEPTLHIPATLEQRRVMDLLAQALHAWHQFHQVTTNAKKLLDTAPAEKLAEVRREVAAMIAKASFDIWRIIVPLVVEEGQQARALAIIDAIATAWTAAQAREWASFTRSVYVLAREISTEDPIPPPLRKYVPLITALAEAETSKDVSVALEKFAAPVGGYKSKLDSGWHGSVTALVGGAAGAEYGEVTDEDMPTMDSKRAWDGQTALFAPVGVDVTYNGWGLFVSVLDVGALTATRWGLGKKDVNADGDDDKEVELPEPTFAQVLSPGIHLRSPLGDSPIVVGFGGSVLPALRGGGDDRETAYRIDAFIAVDITIFPFDIH